MVGWGKLRFSILLLFILVGVLGFTNASTVCSSGCDYTSIQEAINSASAGDTIEVGEGSYDITNTIIIDKPLTLTGSGNSKIEGTSLNALKVLDIQSSDVTIQNFEITTILNSSLAPTEIQDSLVAISGGVGYSGIVIRNNEIYVPSQSGSMSTWVARAITVNDNSADDILIEDNIIYNTRNGIVVRNNNGATIRNNVVFNTKGGIMDYTSNQADADNRLVTGNSWDSTISGIINHNEWDIVWNTAYYVPDYQQSIIELSSENNGAYVVDRRAANEAACANIISNRNIIFVDVNSPNAQTTLKPTNGDFNNPFSSISLALNAVVPNGIIYVSNGTYNEILSVTKNNLTIQAAEGEHPIILAPSESFSSVRRLINLAGNGITLEGFEIIGNNKNNLTNYDGSYLAVRIEGYGITVQNNIIRNALTGIQTTNVNPVTPNNILGNTISNVAVGISLQNDGNYVEDNTINAINEGFGLAAFNTHFENNQIIVGTNGYEARISSGAEPYFGSILDGINAVSNGDTVFVNAGIHNENLNINKGINLVGENKETMILNGKIIINSDNVAVENMKIVPGSLTGNSGDDSGITIYRGNALIKNCIVDGLSGIGPKTVKGIFIHSTSLRENITLENNVVKNINNTVAKGSYGIMVQGAVQDVTVKNNVIESISSTGWAHAVEVTPTCGSFVVPANVVIEGNTISSVTSLTGDRFGFSVDACNSTLIADASEINFNLNNLNNILVRNLDSSNFLNAKNNYWGINPDFENLISGKVSYAPWFSDEGMTDLTMGQTIETNPTTNITTSTIENAINLTTEDIIVSFPAEITISSLNTSWDGTILPPTIRENATVEPNTEGLIETVSKVIEVGFAGTKLILSKAVQIVIPGETGKKVGYSYDGTFYKITTNCSENTQTWADANLAEGADCYFDDGTDMIIWTKHFTEFMTYEENDTAVPDLEYFWYVPNYLKLGQQLSFFARFYDAGGINYTRIRYSFTSLDGEDDFQSGTSSSDLESEMFLEEGDNFNGTWSSVIHPAERDGVLRIRLHANDTSGNGTYYPASPAWLAEITYDGTPANTNLSLNGSNSGNYITSNTQIKLNAIDVDYLGLEDYQPSGVNYSSYKINDGSWNLFGSYTSFTINSSHSDGNYTIDYYSIDNATNIEDTKSTTLTLDNTAPTISIIYPENNTKYNSVISQLNYSASDSGSGLNSCWYNNGTLNSTLNNCLSNFTEFSSNEGLNQWTLYANDSVGNLNLAKVYFTQDTITPEINYNANTPANNSYLNVNSVLVNVSVVENNTYSVILNWNGINESITNNLNGNYWINKANLSDGNYAFYVWVNDSVGHSNLTETRNVIVDTIKPLINFLNSTTSSGNYSQNYIIANISARDLGSGLNNTRIYLRNSTYLVNYTTNEFGVTFANLGDGGYYLNASAEDNAGNFNSTETRTILLDTTAPSVTITSPSNNSNLTSDKTIYVNATDLLSQISNVKYKLVNASNLSQVYKEGNLSYNSGSGYYVGTITNVLADVPVGTYLLQAIATDSVGNEGSSYITLNAVEYVLPIITPIISSVPYGQNSTVQFNISFAIRNGNAVRMKMSDLSNGVDSYSPLELNARLVYNGTEYPVRNDYTGSKIILPSTIAGASGVAVFKMDIPSTMNPGNYNANYQFDITQE